MENSNYDLLVILLKLKSYLISMVDSEENCEKDFRFSEEYLEIKYPEIKELIIRLFRENNINSDCDIVFNDQVHNVFRKMVMQEENVKDLNSILKEFNIDTSSIDAVEKFIEEFKHDRNDSIKEIVKVLLNLAKIWTRYHEIESLVDDFVELDENEVIRPDEEKKYAALDHNASITLDHINVLSKKYIEYLIEYFFKFGGDVQLKDLVEHFEQFKKNVEVYYQDLLNQTGLIKK